MKRIKMLVVLSVVLAMSSTAHAEPPERGVIETVAERGYSYQFDDDPMSASGMVAQGMRLRVRQLGKRTTLIKPRAHFVVELFQSAEHL